MEDQKNTIETKPINNFFCPHSVLEETNFKELSLSAKYLYIILCKLANRYADTEGWFFRSLTALAEDTHMHKSSVSKAKSDLIDGGFINVERGYFEHSRLRTSDCFKLNGFKFKTNKTKK
jgi:DNA-binding MarR family transcriptional regulator